MLRHTPTIVLIIASVILLILSPRSQAYTPPSLPGGVTVVTDSSPEFLQGPPGIRPEVEIAETPPTIDFLFYPEQTYQAEWSAWGEGLAVNGKYYSAIGDHASPHGNSFVYEYNPLTKQIRTVVDLQQVLGLPDTDYTPGKIHSRIDMGSDGWLYFATYRGSPDGTTDAYNYNGDWIIRWHPLTEQTEIVAQGVGGKRTIGMSWLDPGRLIFHGLSEAGDPTDPLQNPHDIYFAHDLQTNTTLYTGDAGSARCFLLSSSTGRAYYPDYDYTPGGRKLVRWDPATGLATKLDVSVGDLRGASPESPDGIIYVIEFDGTIWAFDTTTETAEEIGSALIGDSTNYAWSSIDFDPTGRYLYLVPGTKGRATLDGSAVVQYDLQTNKKKVLAFLYPFYQDNYSFTPIASFGSAVSEDGKLLYVTWHGNDDNIAVRYETCGMMVIHIPEPATLGLLLLGSLVLAKQRR